MWGHCSPWAHDACCSWRLEGSTPPCDAGVYIQLIFQHISACYTDCTLCGLGPGCKLEPYLWLVLQDLKKAQSLGLAADANVSLVEFDLVKGARCVDRAWQ